MAMTARQVYEGVLTEMNKVQAPSMLLEDFNYFINKAVNQYINKKYNVYDVNQQSTDDLRVLKATMVLDVKPTKKYGSTLSGDVTSATSLYGATYEAYLPQDYLHMLNCICNYKVKKQFKCYDPNTYVQFGATRLTADLWGQIINNFYMKPSYKKPYYYLHNVNINTDVPTNPYNFGGTDVAGNIDVDGDPTTDNPTGDATNASGEGTDMNATVYEAHPSAATSSTIYIAVPSNAAFDSNATYYTLDNSGSSYATVTNATSQMFNSRTVTWYTRETIPAGDPYVIGQTGTFNLPRTHTLHGKMEDPTVSLIEKSAGQRLANASKVRVEIRTGKDSSIFELKSIYIDYIKAPQFIRLTQEQIDLTEDTSQMMEFPDYVCQEIINELTHLIMENSSDPRLQSHMPVTMSIANPAQGQTSESSK